MGGLTAQDLRAAWQGIKPGLPPMVDGRYVVALHVDKSNLFDVERQSGW